MVLALRGPSPSFLGQVRILDGIRKAAAASVEGKTEGGKQTKPDDTEGNRMYDEAISELLNTITT